VHFSWTGDPAVLQEVFSSRKDGLLQAVGPLTRRMEERGGGIKSMEVRPTDPALQGQYQLFVNFDTADAMGLLQQGAVDLSFIGGAQVDRYGNLNTSYIGGIDTVETRLPGSGGACDLACLAKRHIIVMSHEKRRFVPRVDYITSPGFGHGCGWREKMGLPRGGPSTVITTLGVLRFDPDSAEMILSSIHPGVTIAQVRHNTGWSLQVAPDLARTPEPTARELKMIRQFDPEGYWTGST
jgi:glutaconate CoA-transferase subunit B